MKNIISVVIVLISILSFEATFGCAAIQVDNAQRRYSRAFTKGDEKALYAARLSNTPINFPFPRLRYDLMMPFTVFGKNDGVDDILIGMPFLLLGIAIDAPFSLVFDIFNTPHDIIGTANGWYDEKYLEPKPVPTISIPKQENFTPITPQS